MTTNNDARFRFEISLNDTEARAWLHQVRIAMEGDLTDLLSGIGMEFESRASGRFETEIDPAGIPWEAWADSTAASYPQHGNGRILDRYGDLLDSLNHQVRNRSVAVGFAQPYALFHETGTATMPRRRVLFADDPEAGGEALSGEDDEALMGIVRVWLDAMLGG